MKLTTHNRSRAIVDEENALTTYEQKSSPKRQRFDRISNLPEPILHQIVLFLSTNDDKTWNAVTTRLLSKTWNAAWNSLPVLEFDQLAFLNSKGNNVNGKKKVQDFSNYVEKTITRHQSGISLQKFQIKINLQNAGRDAVRVQDILRWLNFAITKKVRCLSFHCRKNNSYKDEWRYELPESLFCSKSFIELDLFGCKFLEDGIRTTHIGSCLKKFTLVHVKVDQLSLQSFLSSCCSVEQVSIVNCSGFVTVKLVGVKLEKVEIGLARMKRQTITIEAPNLQYLDFCGEWDNIKSSILGSDCKKLKELKVRDISGRESDIEQIVSVKFPLIENVVLNVIGLKHPRYIPNVLRKFNMVIEGY